jgi:hypothetical protein
MAGPESVESGTAWALRPLEPAFGESAPEAMSGHRGSRLELVEGAIRWMPYPVAEGLLLCDRAAALLGEGRTAEATQVLSDDRALAALRELGEAALGVEDPRDAVALRRSRQLTELVLADLLAVARHVERTVEDGRDLADLVADLEVQLRLRDGTIGELAEPLSSLMSAEGVAQFKGGAMPTARLDLQAVSPRVFAWRGPEAGGIDVAVVDGGVEVRLPLQRPLERGEGYRVIVADRGDVQAVALHADADAGRLVGRASIPRDAIGRAVLTVAADGASTAALVQRARGRTPDVERLLVEAWATSRLAHAARLATRVDAAADERLLRRWVTQAPTADAHAASARQYADLGGIDPVLRRTASEFAGDREWDLVALGHGAARPLLSEVAFVLGEETGTHG